MHQHDHHHDHDHTHGHTNNHSHEHAHSHTHEHEHAHSHDHDHTHSHDHTSQPHQHDDLLKSKEEAAAFLQYTLNHNAHHEEELDGLAHSLEHLQLQKEAQTIRQCIEDIARANARLEDVLSALK